jgi:hypothetical protein
MMWPKYCIWCSKQITRKYIKKCNKMQTEFIRCKIGPFCTKKCLFEHYEKAPHYREI